MYAYALNLCQLIHSTIVGTTHLILEKKKLLSYNYNSQPIAVNHPQSLLPVSLKNTYHNLYCEHFEGITYEEFSTLKNCPHCLAPILFSSSEANQSCRNIFQGLLSKNYLNPSSANVKYYFQEMCFTL